MRVYLGSDHAGFELKEAIVRRLTELGHEPVDHGGGLERAGAAKERADGESDCDAVHVNNVCVAHAGIRCFWSLLHLNA